MHLPEALTGLRDEGTLDRLLAIVDKARQDLEDLLSGAVMTQNVFAVYQNWARDTIDALRPLIALQQIDDLVRSRGYWTLQTVAWGTSSAPTNAVQLVNSEARDRLGLFAELADALAALAEWRCTSGALVAADTSVYLHHRQSTNAIDEIDWCALSDLDDDLLLVVPIAVLDELDRLKETGRSNKQDPYNPRARARGSVRSLARIMDNPGGSARLRESVSIELILDDPRHVALSDSDSEIVERLWIVQWIAGRPVRLITGDVGMAARARARGLQVTFIETRGRDS